MSTRSENLAKTLKRKRRRPYEPPAPQECTCHLGHPPCSWCMSQPDPDAEPGFQPPATLAEYLEQFAPALAKQAQNACQPLHVPGEDEPLEVPLLREPYEAQQHVITAGVKALRRQRGLQVSGEMGVGKSLIMSAICQGHSKDRGYRALIFCPPHLVHKWEREIRNTLTNAHVHHLSSYHDLTRLLRDAPAVGRGWWIVSSTRAKMGAKWRAAYLPRRRSVYLRCPDCHAPLKRFDKKLQADVAITGDDLGHKKHTCPECDAPLWTWTHEIDRWPIAAFIHKKLPGWFDYVVIDESHQAKSSETAIGQAMGSLAAGCKRIIAGTGTVFGGYAWHIRPILYRMAPGSLIEEGIGWDEEMKFNERYGRLERRVTTTESHGGRDNRQSKGTTTKTAKYVRPGVMPTLFGRHLIGSTIFLSLDEVAEALPKLEEKIIDVPMDQELIDAYCEVEQAITAELKLMLQRKDKRLLSKMLHTLLGYPDHPYDWKEIGYMDRDEDGFEIWRHVVTPQSLARDVVRPKEQALVDLVRRELAEGRKSWVYCVMTDARDVNERLRMLLANAGLRVEVLRASIETTEREAWIAKHAPECDVIISHPQLVETGLDFFQKLGDGYAYNVCSIIGYSLGYSTFTMRQAMRRHWRIGQREVCRNYYLHYADTMQSRALALMGKKLVASTSIEGKFTSEGLAALAGDEGTLEVALAKSLTERLEDTDVGRVWQKLGQAVVAQEPLVPLAHSVQTETNDGPAEFELPPPRHVFGRPKRVASPAGTPAIESAEPDVDGLKQLAMW